MNMYVGQHIMCTEDGGPGKDSYGVILEIKTNNVKVEWTSYDGKIWKGDNSHKFIEMCIKDFENRQFNKDLEQVLK